MKKQKRATRTNTNTRTVIFVPERKISEAILELAEPILEPLGKVPELEAARRAVELAVSVWNFHVMATALWGKPHFLAQARARMRGPASPPELAVIFESLVERRVALFSDDYRAVGNWSLEPDGAGGYSLRCEAMLPDGCEAHVPPPAETRIAVGGRFLDEVRIRQSGTSSLSFPPPRHRATASGERITIETPAYVAAQLFADGSLPPIRSAAVEVAAHAQPSRRMVLVEVQTGSRPLHGDVVSLTFEPATGVV